MKLRDKNVLITGGAGFIGSHLCDAIIREQPRCCAVMDNLFLGNVKNLESAYQCFPELKFYNQSVCNCTDLEKLILENEIEVVFNLAVIPLPASLIKPKLACVENIISVLNLCELLRQKAFKTLIHCSSSEAYGTAQYVPMDEQHPYEPSTPYAASKAAGDQICLSYVKTYGADLSIVRPFNNYGTRQNSLTYAGIIPIVVKKVLNKEPIEIYGDGTQTRDYIFVRETVGAMIKIYESESTRGKVINVAQGKEISVNDLVAEILEIMNAKDAEVKYVAPRPADVQRHCADISLARSLINFEPKIPFKVGLVETVAWYIQEMSDDH